MRGVRTFALQLLCVALPAVPALARAQGAADASPHGEVRADAIVDGQGTALQVGAGIQIPAGYYTRIGVVAGVGSSAAARTGEGRQLSARVDVLGRFLIDPFRQTRWGLSVGAGVSLRAEAARAVRPFLVAVADLEGPRSAGGVSPAIQLGLGGGVRLGMALRWGERGAR